MLCGFVGSQSIDRTCPLFSWRGALKEPSFSVKTSVACRKQEGGTDVTVESVGRYIYIFIFIYRASQPKRAVLQHNESKSEAYFVYRQLLDVVSCVEKQMWEQSMVSIDTTTKTNSKQNKTFIKESNRKNCLRNVNTTILMHLHPICHFM